MYNTPHMCMYTHKQHTHNKTLKNFNWEILDELIKADPFRSCFVKSLVCLFDLALGDSKSGEQFAAATWLWVRKADYIAGVTGEGLFSRSHNKRDYFLLVYHYHSVPNILPVKNKFNSKDYLWWFDKQHKNSNAFPEFITFIL